MPDVLPSRRAGLWPRMSGAWLLGLALVLTLSIVTASQLFTDRIGRMLDGQAAELLAADLLIVSSEPLPDSWAGLAQEQGLRVARSVSLRTAIFLDDEPQLIELKAVSPGYPLRGRLETRNSLFAPAQPAASGPPPGALWVDGKLERLLGQSIELGEARLPVTRLLSFEPDRGGSLFNLAPRVMMALEDLPGTGLIVPGSRARYRLLVAGERGAVARYADILRPLLREGQQLQTLDSARPEMRRALERTRRFFALATLLTLVIAMTAIALTARHAAAREETTVAVLRSFGISSRRLIRYYLGQLLRLWLWAAPLGLLLGWAAQFPLQWLLGAWFGLRLPEGGPGAYGLALLVGALALVGFSLPPILRLLDTPPSRVLRDQASSHNRRSLGLQLFSLLALFAILWLMLDEALMAVLLLGAIVVAALLLPLLFRALIGLLRRVHGRGFWLPGYLYSRLLAPGRHALLVLSGFSLTLFALLLLTQVKDQLLEDWELQLPEDKPNYFLVNIAPDQVRGLEDWLDTRAIPASRAYPLVRTRLRAIGGVPVEQLRLEGNDAQRLINHVFNLSWSDTLPPDNAVVQGAWSAGEGLSVEQGMAEKLGIAPGDRLQFSVGSQVFEAPVTSIRSVLWENFQPNFYVLAPQRLLEDLPQTWLLSAFVDEDHRSLLKPLLQAFPGITLLDLSELMARIKGIIDRASLALQFFFAFALLAGLLVLLAALNTTRVEREREMALLRALGASGRQALRSQFGELLLMGVLAGLSAALLAQLSGWVVARQVFDLQPRLSAELWIIGLLAGVLLISLPGALFLRRSLGVSPMRLLRGGT